MNSAAAIFHLPKGIRFECTRCTNCCLSWPVPLTESDVKRLSEALSLPSSDLPISFLSPAERSGGLVGFTRSLEKRADGRCSYLVDTGCSLHGLAKPAMCQLFPYTFMDTPDGTFVGLSFASSGVIMNSGKLLSEQENELLQNLDIFRSLFPTVASETIAGWKRIALVEGVPLDYEKYTQLESALLHEIEQSLASGTTRKTAISILLNFFQGLKPFCPSLVWRESLPGSVARPKQIDQILVATFAAAYVDESQSAKLLDDRMIAEAVAAFLQSPPASMSLTFGGRKCSAIDFLSKSLDLPPACEDLLLRYVYVRIFSKMYFGPGFSNLSLIAGTGHLFLLIVLMRLSLKAKLLSEQTSRDEIFVWLTALLRQVDSKFASARYGANTRAMIEVLFLDPERCSRLMELAR